MSGTDLGVKVSGTVGRRRTRRVGLPHPRQICVVLIELDLDVRRPGAQELSGTIDVRREPVRDHRRLHVRARRRTLATILATRVVHDHCCSKHAGDGTLLTRPITVTCTPEEVWRRHARHEVQHRVDEVSEPRLVDRHREQRLERRRARRAPWPVSRRAPAVQNERARHAHRQRDADVMPQRADALGVMPTVEEDELGRDAVRGHLVDAADALAAGRNRRRELVHLELAVLDVGRRACQCAHPARDLLVGRVRLARRRQLREQVVHLLVVVTVPLEAAHRVRGGKRVERANVPVCPGHDRHELVLVRLLLRPHRRDAALVAVEDEHVRRQRRDLRGSADGDAVELQHGGAPC